MSLTPSQSAVLDLVHEHQDNSERLFILWYGGIRAGKTYGMVKAGIEHAKDREHRNYIVGGKTIRSIINNIAPYFREICDDMGLEYKLVTGGINPRCEIGSNQFLFYGGDSRGRDENVQGLTANGLLLDEFELLNRDFVKQCEGRISDAGSIRVYTSNKGQPYSWAKKDYFDRVVEGTLDAVLIDSNPEENNFIDQDFWEEKNAEYDDYYRRRFVENEFALVNEPLYEPTYVTEPDNAKLDTQVVFSYGRHHFMIPIYKVKSTYIIGEVEGRQPPIEPKSLSRDALVLINSTASMLGRELTQMKFTVRGYADMFLPHKYEFAQRAFSTGRVKVLETAKGIRECIETHAYPEDTVNPEIVAIESGIEYLTRLERWQ